MLFEKRTEVCVCIDDGDMLDVFFRGKVERDIPEAAAEQQDVAGSLREDGLGGLDGVGIHDADGALGIAVFQQAWCCVRIGEGCRTREDVADSAVILVQQGRPV